MDLFSGAEGLGKQLGSVLGDTRRRSKGKAGLISFLLPPLFALSPEQTIQIKASIRFQVEIQTACSLWDSPLPEIRGPWVGPECAESPAGCTLPLALQDAGLSASSTQ